MMKNHRQQLAHRAWLGASGCLRLGRVLLSGWMVLGGGLLRAQGEADAPRFSIREFRVTGSKLLSEQEIGEAVYPFLGPGRSVEDVEGARAALEGAFRAKGYQAVGVQLPEQSGRRGVFVLQVIENRVGQMRVKGSRYFSLEEIRRRAPSLAAGAVVDFNRVSPEILALNQHPDMRVTPSLRAGREAGTVDVELSVEDKLPLHGSVELNNRHSSGTTDLRLNTSVSYQNLWQKGHGLGLNLQYAPQRPEDAKVISGFYLARFPEASWLSLMLQGVKQDSNVSTLGGAAVAGRGDVWGARLMMTLPGAEGFYHSVSLGLDYKHFLQALTIGDFSDVTPVTYWPLSAVYNATWSSAASTTELSAGVHMHFRGTGSASEEFAVKRYKADGDYFYARAELSHTRDLPAGFQGQMKLQGQATQSALLDNEQFSAGGLGTVRGYLESAALGDNALVGSLELRSPSLGRLAGLKPVQDWRVYVFAEGGVLGINDALPDQASVIEMASVGAGSRLQIFEHSYGSLDAGFPLRRVGTTERGDMLFTFRVWAEF